MNRKKNILIIEDDPIILEIFTRVLKNALNVFPCKNLAEYKADLAITDFDVFIIDLSLGGQTDGIALIKELRSSEKYKSTPVLVVTAHAFQVDENAAMKAGATKFLRKPVENKSLLAEVMGMLKEKINE